MMMNPPLEWDVEYIIDVEFFGKPTSGDDIAYLGVQN